ncbi:hypothetical protein Ciccas_007025 [Cichlidogyrus casuarinus]|uniref:14-3-3 domain-containing protein n=1 Tax=Cichlidogyrus casuarinus TaxID=1844966 RepID=A0ABD2Q437_9PLAT
MSYPYGYPLSYPYPQYPAYYNPYFQPQFGYYYQPPQPYYPYAYPYPNFELETARVPDTGTRRHRSKPNKEEQVLQRRKSREELSRRVREDRTRHKSSRRYRSPDQRPVRAVSENRVIAQPVYFPTVYYPPFPPPPPPPPPLPEQLPPQQFYPQHYPHNSYYPSQIRPQPVLEVEKENEDSPSSSIKRRNTILKKNPQLKSYLEQQNSLVLEELNKSNFSSDAHCSEARPTLPAKATRNQVTQTEFVAVAVPAETESITKASEGATINEDSGNSFPEVIVEESEKIKEEEEEVVVQEIEEPKSEVKRKIILALIEDSRHSSTELDSGFKATESSSLSTPKSKRPSTLELNLNRDSLVEKDKLSPIESVSENKVTLATSQVEDDKSEGYSSQEEQATMGDDRSPAQGSGLSEDMLAHLNSIMAKNAGASTNKERRSRSSTKTFDRKRSKRKESDVDGQSVIKEGPIFDLDNGNWLKDDATVDNLILLARIAEKAHKYDDMAMAMRLRLEMDPELNNDERNLFAVAWKRVIDKYRDVLNELKEQINQFDPATMTFLKKYREKVYEEFEHICKVVIKCTKADDDDFGSAEGHVFFKKLRADYYRYLADGSIDDESKKQYEKTALRIYEEAFGSACQELSDAHAVRLGCAINYSIFLYDVVGKKSKAFKIAKDTFDTAMNSENMMKLSKDQVKDTTFVLQLLKDNIQLWAGENEMEGEMAGEYMLESGTEREYEKPSKRKGRQKPQSVGRK